MNDKLFDPSLNLYNPATQSAEQLLAEFIDRKGLLERILELVGQNAPSRPQQHVILIGPRGMGKTTLLCAIRHRVHRDEALNAEWLPILFHEEQYGIGDLADFWLESLRHLEAALNRRAQAAERLLDEDPENLAERAQERFFQILAESGKRALLLLDNLNDIFTAIDDGFALNKLRALWMTDPRIMVIGAAPSYFEKITAVDQAFHDFFRCFSLDRLSQEELESFLRRFAEILGDEQVMRIIEQTPQRVAALRILTGGNPRLVKLGYRVLRDGLDGDARRDLECLLDECTPFFKHRIDSLAKEARRAFDAIARRWDPVTVDDIRRELRKPSNYVSAQIKRLIDEGFVEEAGGEKKKRYQVSERFYNVYYLMRHSREGRRRLRWLIAFMQTFYTRHDYQHWAKRLESDLAEPQSETWRSEKLAHLHAMSEAADYAGRASVFETLVRDAIAQDDRRELDEEFAGGDPVEMHGFRYLAAEVLWLLKPETRRSLGFKPGDSDWWTRLRRMLFKAGLTANAELLFAELNGAQINSAGHADASGVILEWLFLRHAEAESAFRNAIEIDPQYLQAWNGLGVALYDQHRFDEAEAAYRKAIEIDPQYVQAWNNLGILLNGQHRSDEAEAAYRKAIEIGPQYAYAWTNLSGTYLLYLNRREEGISTLLKGLSLDPELDYGRYVLGRFWQASLPAAAKQIVANDPGADNLRNALIETLLEQAVVDRNAVREALLALDERDQQPFEALLLALQALDDRSVLYRIAREKRDLVLDVMARIAPDQKPA